MSTPHGRTATGGSGCSKDPINCTNQPDHAAASGDWDWVCATEFGGLVKQWLCHGFSALPLGRFCRAMSVAQSNGTRPRLNIGIIKRAGPLMPLIRTEKENLREARTLGRSGRMHGRERHARLVKIVTPAAVQAPLVLDRSAGGAAAPLVRPPAAERRSPE
jgi:hypothetical protein